MLQKVVLITAKCVSFAFLLHIITLSCDVAEGGHKLPFLQVCEQSCELDNDVCHWISIRFWLRNYHQHIQTYQILQNVVPTDKEKTLQ
jgi:hypothetical protein